MFDFLELLTEGLTVPDIQKVSTGQAGEVLKFQNGFHWFGTQTLPWDGALVFVQDGSDHCCLYLVNLRGLSWHGSGNLLLTQLQEGSSEDHRLLST